MQSQEEGRNYFRALIPQSPNEIKANDKTEKTIFVRHSKKLVNKL